MKKVKLTDPQFQFLQTLVLAGSNTAVAEFKPPQKLVELGLAIAHEEGYRVRYEVTDAGRAHHEAVFLAPKRCASCKKAEWTCRVCTRKTCEHYCGKKGADRTAICGRQACQRAGEKEPKSGSHDA